MAVDPQGANVRFALTKIGRLSGLTQEEVEQVLPPSVDELTADTENEKLDAGELVMVQVYDDDFIHMEMHNKASDTPVKYAHIEAHKRAMMLKRVNPAMDMARNRPENPTEAPPAPGVKFAQGGGAGMPVKPMGQ